MSGWCLLASAIVQYQHKIKLLKKTKKSQRNNLIMLNKIQFQNNRVSTAKIKSDIKNKKKMLKDATLQEVTNNTSCKTKLRLIEVLTENGASIWLTVIQIKRNGFFLEKQAFWDAMRIRYNIPLERLLTLCVCGDSFNLQHALSCPKGGLVTTRHNKLRNLTAEILGEVCKKPLLIPLTGEELPKSSNTCSQVRADVSARGLWINGQTAFCDVRVFNPLARCHLHHSLPAVHKKNKNEKKREYN